MTLNLVCPSLQRVERELDVARVERGAPLVLAHDGREVLEGRLGDDLVRLLLQYFLDYLLFGLKKSFIINAAQIVSLVLLFWLRTYNSISSSIK